MRKLILSFLIVFSVNTLFSQSISQQLLSTSGESFQNSSYTIDWSIGECMTATFDAEDYVLTQGFHQSFYTISTIEDLQSELVILVYPNPVEKFITIELPAAENKNLILSLSDISGRKIMEIEPVGKTEQIDFSAFTSGIYIIQAKHKNQIIKSFKIIKK
jgi:hypothetical protein